MNIITLNINNLRRIHVGEIKFPPYGVVQVTGANETGKSTLLNAIKWPLAGKAGVPEHVVTEGLKSGSITMTVGDGNTPSV